MDEFDIIQKTRSTPVRIPFPKSKFDPNIKMFTPTILTSPKPKIKIIEEKKEEVKVDTEIEEEKEDEIVEEKVEKKVEEKKIEEKKVEKKEEKKVEVKKEVQKEVKEEKKPKISSPPKKEKVVVKVPKYELMTEQEKEKEYNKFEDRFDTLRNYLKGTDVQIPELDRNLPLTEINKMYNKFVKNIHINGTTGKYKVYMVILWLFIEYACTKIGLNVGGYTMSQMKAMEKYEILLIKLGEKNYKYEFDPSNQWPVEFDILFMALINAIAFIVIKMLCDSVGMDKSLANTIIDTISNYLSGNQQQPNVLFNDNSEGNNVDLPNLLANLGGMFLNNNNKNNKKQQRTGPAYAE